MLPKKRLFMMNAFRWAPGGFTTWMLERDKGPGMVNARKNREYAHEVATKLIREKRQELKDGASRRDVLSLLGTPYILFINLGARCNFQLFSQGGFCPTARMAAK